jgi:hypothetical protein
MRWLRRFGEPGWRGSRQGGNSATGLYEAILTACGCHPRAIPLFLPAVGPGLELPGSVEATPSILLLKPPSRIGCAHQLRCQVVGLRQMGSNHSVFPDPGEKLA